MLYFFSFLFFFTSSTKIIANTNCLFEAPIRFTNIYPNSDGSFCIIGHKNSRMDIDERKVLAAFNDSGELLFKLDLDDYKDLKELGLLDLGQYRVDAISTVYKYRGQYLLILRVSDLDGNPRMRAFILNKDGNHLVEATFSDERKIPIFNSFTELGDGALYSLYTEQLSVKYGFSSVWRQMKITPKNQGEGFKLAFIGSGQFHNRGSYEGLVAMFPRTWLVDVAGERLGVKQNDPALYFLDQTNRKIGQGALKLDNFVSATSIGINKHGSLEQVLTQDLWYGFSKITSVNSVDNKILVSYIIPDATQEKGFSLAISLLDNNGKVVKNFDPYPNGFFVNATQSKITLMTQDSQTGCFHFSKQNIF